MSGVLTFDEASHTYHRDGLVVPSVTQILGPLSDFSMVPSITLAAASSFGTAVHKACELDDLGDLDEATIDAELIPYLYAWRAFCADSGARWSHIEARVYHPRLRYAGTLDRFGTLVRLNGVSLGGEREAVVDIKTTAEIYPSVGPQLAAYAEAEGKPHALRVAVQLKADGTYHAHQFNSRTDWPMFASMLTVRTWCREHNVVPVFKP